MANANKPSEDYIATIEIIRYVDVRASSPEAARAIVQRDLSRHHGATARIKTIQKG